MTLKKAELIIFVIITGLSFPAFCDKSRFFREDKVIDTMFVDSPDGLNVRNSPDIKGKKLCSLYYTSPAKIVAVGKEVTIDGITAPWVEILIPRYFWKSDEPEYGWIFGGYLTEKNNVFKQSTYILLQGHYWENDVNIITEYEDFDGKYTSESKGRYVVDFESKGFGTGTFRYKLCENFEDDDGDNVERLLVDKSGTWEIDSNGSIVFRIGSRIIARKKLPRNYDNFDLLIDFASLPLNDGYTVNENDCSMPIATFPDQFDLKKSYIYNIAFADFSDDRDKNNFALSKVSRMIEWHPEKKAEYKKLAHDLIVCGVCPDGSGFIDDYHAYWNPIMAEHQKKNGQNQ